MNEHFSELVSSLLNGAIRAVDKARKEGNNSDIQTVIEIPAGLAKASGGAELKIKVRSQAPGQYEFMAVKQSIEAT